jgi:transposase
MPKIIRVCLTPDQRADLNQLARSRSLAPQMRERLEMIRLSDLGHTIPQIARTLDRHPQTVRKHLQAFRTSSDFAVLTDAPRSGRPLTLTAAHLQALEQLLDESAQTGRTWTLGQLAAWLREQHGVRITPIYLSERLKQRRFRWKRTYRSVRHKQKDPQLHADKKAALESLNL